MIILKKLFAKTIPMSSRAETKNLFQIRKLKRSALGVFSLAISLLALNVQLSHGQVTIEISPIYSSVAFELSHPPLSDVYRLIYKAPNKAFRLVVFDGRDVQTRNPKPVFLLNQPISGSSVVKLPNSRYKAGTVVSFFNDGQFPAKLSYIVFRTGVRSTEVTGQLRKVIEIPVSALDKFYRLPKFKVGVLPCGTVNAYSNPDVTICSELIADLFEKKLDDALYPILLHEMAHSLLNLWNLPGYDNEDVADEFAAVILSRVSPRYIDAFIKYLENADSTTEAIVQLTRGSRHTVSIQRARNMKAAMSNIDQIEKRWSNLLRDYSRNQP